MTSRGLQLSLTITGPIEKPSVTSNFHTTFFPNTAEYLEDVSDEVGSEELGEMNDEEEENGG